MKRKGFSLVEMVISMALVMIITAAVALTVQGSAEINKGLVIKENATRMSDNVLACFCSDSFTAGLKLLHGRNDINPKDLENFTLYYSTGGSLLGVDEEPEDAAWRIEVSTQKLPDINGDRIKITAIRPNVKEPIYEINYTKYYNAEA